jgi:hypothetical protein
MRMTLLDMTQNILSNMSSDEVNSYSDTTESMQVASIIRETYFNMLSRYNLPENDQLFQLDASTDGTQPVLMYVPKGINKIDWVKYFDTNPLDGSNTQTDQYGAYSEHDVNVDLQDNANTGLGNGSGPFYRPVAVTSLEKFLHLTSTLNTTDSNVEVFEFTVTNQATGEPSSYKFYFYNDRQPQHCCIVSNYYVIFDSFDSTQDSTLQSSKTMCHGWVLPTFEMKDDFIPMLDDKQFPLLLSEAKSLAFFELKQQPHQKAEQEIKRQISSLQKYKSDLSRPTDFDQLPDYGRRGSGWL